MPDGVDDSGHAVELGVALPEDDLEFGTGVIVSAGGSASSVHVIPRSVLELCGGFPVSSGRRSPFRSSQGSMFRLQALAIRRCRWPARSRMSRSMFCKSFQLRSGAPGKRQTPSVQAQWTRRGRRKSATFSGVQ